MSNLSTVSCEKTQTGTEFDLTPLLDSIRNLGCKQNSMRLPDNFAFLDDRFLVRNADPEFCKLFKKDHDNIIGVDLSEILQSKDVNLSSKFAQLEKGKRVDFDLTSALPIQTENSVHLSVRPETGTNGEVLGFFAQLRCDSAPTDVRDDVGSFDPKLILDDFQGFILSLNRDGQILYANQAFASSFGIEPEAAVGMNLSSLIGHQAYEKVSKHKIRLVFSGQAQNFTNEFVSVKGENRTFLVSLMPGVRRNGEIENVVGIANDITSMVVATNELKRMCENFETSVKNSGVGIIEFDSSLPDWCYANHIEILLGLMPGELRNSRAVVRARIHPDDLDTNDNARMEQNAGSDTKYEMRLLDSDGRYRWFAFSFHLRDELGTTRKPWVGTISDIDELKNTQLNSVNQIARRDEFLAMLSHELRNPLMAIRYSVDLLTDFQQARVDSREFLEIISRQTTQMSQLLDDLLDVARITQNRIVLNIANCELNDAIREVVETVRSVFVDNQQLILVNLAPDELFVDGDSVRIKQAMINLLENASKYSTNGGRIVVRSERLGNRMRFSVQDDGQGIAEKDMENIFDLFYQAGKTSGGASVGMGVGLFLVKHVIEKHGGQVAVDSNGLGTGSRFSFKLPLVDQKPEPTTTDGPKFHGTKRICLVEDIADSRIALKILLEHRGFEVFEFADGESAARKIPEINPDVAIVDIGLPGMNGMQLAAELRNKHKMNGVFLIALTGYGQQADRAMIDDAGFDRHIVKPAGIKDVCQVISDLYAQVQ